MIKNAIMMNKNNESDDVIKDVLMATTGMKS